MDSPTVSVIIPFYQRANWLLEAVDSVFDQTYSDFEVIVIDDGSKEDLTLFSQKYTSLIIYHCKDNGGAASARNVGITLAKGKYIAFLDSDDIWLPDKLKMQVEWMESTGATWSHTCYSTFENSSNNIKHIDTSRFSGQVYPKCLIKNPIATPCVMIRSDVLKSKLELRFNEDMRYGQDFYLWMLIAYRKYNLEVIPYELSKVRLRGNNAALRAKVQLRTKAHIWTIFKSDMKTYVNGKRLPYIIKLIYSLCFIGNNIAIWIRKKANLNETADEFVAKIFYTLPFIMIKCFFNKRK